MRTRILHVIGSLETGGAETALVRICRATSVSGLDHQVLVLGRSGPLASELRTAGIDVLIPRVNPLDTGRLLRSAGGGGPQIVQGWMYHGSLAALALKSILFPTAALVWSIRCGLDTFNQYRSSTRGLIRLLAAFSRNPDSILYNAISARETHESMGYESSRGAVIPNGFDLETFRPDLVARYELRSELGLGQDGQILGFIARFHPEKNPGMFLRALSRLPQHVQGLMVGSGMSPGNSLLWDQVRSLHLEGRVHLLGERRDMPRVMAGLDVAVSASWNEGFSNALGEAQACGVPCVATEVGDSALLIGGLGRLVPPGEEAAMAQALSELLELSQEARSALERRCRQRMEGSYDLSLVARRYSDLYHRLADRL